MRLALRSLVYFWRTNTGVVLGAACATAVLVGALVVGDSVRLSLRDQALRRIGKVDHVLSAPERFFRADLADRITAEVAGTAVAPVLALRGLAKDPDRKGARAGIVDVFGVDDRFFAMSPAGGGRAPQPGKVFVNERLARQLGVASGGTILLRVDKPGSMPRDMVLTTVDEVSVARRVEVEAVVGEDGFGRFGLRASQVPPFDLFAPLSWLQELVGLPGRANMLLADGTAGADALDAGLRATWTLADAGLKVRVPPGTGCCELGSDQVFMEPVVAEAARQLGCGLTGVLTYFVNELRCRDRATPYSMVAAIGRRDPPADPATDALLALVAPVEAPEGGDGIVLNRWCADDLRAKVGDPVTLRYYKMGAGQTLVEHEAAFTVRGIAELSGAAADPSLSPVFPGISDSENCRDWDPGVPVKLDRIRDEDEKYWDDHRGTPKAFVTLEAGQRLWRNAYGDLTALRGPARFAQRLETELPRRLDPKALGLFFQDFVTPALAGGTSATDFGGLFIGLSFFLILAALLLTALLFQFGVEQRAREIGTLLAVGFRPRAVRRIFLAEAALLAGLGAALGAGLGLLYTKGVLWGLGTLWQDAVGATTLAFHAPAGTVAGGAVGAVLVAVLAIFLALRRAFDLPAVELLASQEGLPQRPVGEAERGWISLVLVIGGSGGALALAVFAGTSAEQVAGAFFGAGALLLVATLALCRRFLVAMAGGGRGIVGSVGGLGVRNTGRRVGRSLATVALLASGTFLVVAVQANRLEAPLDPEDRAAGTGGFTLFGRTTLPVLRDLTTQRGMDEFGIDARELEGAGIVPLRVREGDDASCLNLSLAQNPRLVGVAPGALADRRAFTFAGVLPEAGELDSPWRLLDRDYGPDVLPAVGDAASVTWALHKAVGDDLAYVDERGRGFKVRIVGVVANSILQGNLVVAEDKLKARYPTSVSGYRMFLVDTPPAGRARVEAGLNRGLEDLGLELTTTQARLQAFNAVQNTYLLIFQALGGLGLLLGSVGVGLVVLRNALERRGELAVLAAVGYPQRAVRRLVWIEHGVLLALGVGCGVVAALIAVLPSVLQASAPLSIGPMLWLVTGVVLSGALWVWLATLAATRGPLLETLRGE